MKFSSVLTFFLAALTASATPLGLYKRQNVTSGGSTVPVIITGGPAISGSQSNVTTTTLFNSTSTLNITQLYQIATQVNQTLQSGSSSGIIIVTNWRSIETLSFFCSIVFNTSKTIVITENYLWGVPILSSSHAEGRGTVVAGSDKVIYSGVFPPYTVPVGISNQKEVQWFFDACQPILVASNSTLRLQYSNFTNAQISSNTSSASNTSSSASSGPLVPIIYEEGYSQTLIQSLSSSIQGLVVISSGISRNSTVTSWTSVDFPVVYATDGSSSHDGSGIGFLSNTSIPQGAISAGYLSPIQAQTLLSIAINNQVTGHSELQDIFPAGQQ
ncbi:sps100p [Saccharomyces arboricola H-6]|uniref:Sps100p n=1 Tax=Saccharomyces arboricola (strain H-6 / AS 2.3317 / CBS 10644) TaxID=1160507 RepID=J8PMM0_SACAR|nr:sps100p [Saccharomyces arboricola H-6]